MTENEARELALELDDWVDDFYYSESGHIVMPKDSPTTRVGKLSAYLARAGYKIVKVTL